MGRSINAQNDKESEYVDAVYKYVLYMYILFSNSIESAKS